MLITPLQLQIEPLIFAEEIAPGQIEYTSDTHQVGPLPVEGRADLLVEHGGPVGDIEDIRVRAAYSGYFQVECARCLEPVSLPVEGRFDLVFRPEGVDAAPGERALSEDETEIGYYGRAGLLLEDVVREQVLFSLPGRTLCREDCQGLCAQCGKNRNDGPCNCTPPVADPRWGALQELASTLKQ